MKKGDVDKFVDVEDAKAGLGKQEPINDLAPSSEAEDEVKRPPVKWGYTNILQRTFFLQVEKLVSAGYKSPLNPEDTFPSPLLHTAPLYDTFEAAWKREQLKPKPDIRLAIMAGRWHLFFFTGVLYCISQATQLAGPLLLQQIVEGLSCLAVKRDLDRAGSPAAALVTCDPQSKLYYYCIGLFVAPFIQSICDNQSTYLLYVLGTQCRNALMAAIYRKCLRLSNSSLQAESTGKVVTLMSNDAQKMQDAMMMIHATWASPLFIIAVLILLWFQVGWATFVGLGIMLTLVPITGKLAATMGTMRRELLSWTEKRVGLMSELINGMQMIKLYAWEGSFAAEVLKARNGERGVLRRQALWMSFFGLILFTGPTLVAIFCFGSYALTGHVITTARAYTALSLFGLLRFPMSVLPMLIIMVVNAVIGLRRIGKFLEHSEAAMPENDGAEVALPGVVTITGGEFRWDEKAEKPTLSGIDIQLQAGTLTMVVGSVGSGKSSILGALVGHMSMAGSSKMTVGGTTAYVAQNAWIMNDTLQENVLIGAVMDADRYAECLEVSQLGPDLDILPDGDLTEIGDRGITLSGGQKQRVSIARAVYFDADVVLLDDPLSAVDSHVGRALFETCIRGTLRHKTVLLVTNALQYLPHADHIVWMELGTIKAQGTYSQVLAAGLNVAELAHTEDEERELDQDTAGSKIKGGKGAADGLLSAAVSGKVSPTKLRRQATSGLHNKNLTGEELRESGTISWHVAKTYFGGGGGWHVFFFLFCLFALEQGVAVYNTTWVGNWFSNKYDKSTGFYLGFYAWLGMLYGAVTFVRCLVFLLMMVTASVSLHNRLLHHVLRLPKSFFDTNPAGRVLNRFSRDTDVMDTTLPQSFIQFAGCLATIIATFIVISIATKWFAIAIPPLTVIYIIIQRYYIPTARELQRIESVTRSPIYSKFAEAMQGIVTIRAYRKEAHFTAISDNLIEQNASAFVTQKLAAGWLAQRLDLMGLFVLTGAGCLCVAGSISPTAAGLCLVYALDLTRYLKQGTNMASKAEADFNSAERVVQYLAPATEAAVETEAHVSKGMDPHWPSAGAISISKLTMRYRPSMPLVLRGVTFEVEAGSKVGLVGRTGSGKSSLFLALFRMVEPESGCIMIDGVDTASLGLRHLRSKMSIIPQDPFMFSGTIRVNLDPFEGHPDDELWRVLEAVGLKSVISELDGKLGSTVVDNGGNFSLGQRQLFCMARAMLRQSRILVLDEATASVDLETDNLLQTAIRTAFKDFTLITIAHRLNTIMDSDRVVVMDAGRVSECAAPDALLQNDEGIFTGMVAQTGRASARFLKGLATSASTARMQRDNSVFKTGASFAAGQEGSPVSPQPSGGVLMLNMFKHVSTLTPSSSSSSLCSDVGGPSGRSDVALLTPGRSSDAPPRGGAGGAVPPSGSRLRKRSLGVLGEEGHEGEEGHGGKPHSAAAATAAAASQAEAGGSSSSGSARHSSEITSADDNVDDAVLALPPPPSQAGDAHAP